VSTRDTWAINTPLVNGVADRDVAVSVAVGSHIPLGSEACPQVCLRVLHGNQNGAFRCLVFAAGVEHVLVSVDQAGQNRRLVEIDHLRSCRNLDLSLRTNLGNSITRENYHLSGQHLAGLAIEQASGADRDHSHRRRALQDTAV